MANNMLIKASFLLSMALLILSTSEQMCCENNALLETTGDVILTVFVDANYGQHCNVSSNKGLQQILTILHVVRTLNKYNYIPNVKLGLRIFDTCHDRITVFRQVLRVAVEQSCAPDYEMGILMPSQYGPMMEYLHSYNGLPIGIYEERDFTVPMIDILTHYLSTKCKIVDLVHANTDSVLDHFLEVTKDAGVCVKRSDSRVNGDRYANVTEMVIVAIGKRNDVQRWLEENEKSRDSGETWFLLPLDNSDINDLIPSESYVIKPEIPRFDLGELSSAGEFLENSNNSANHSPYLLDIGKAVIKLAEVFQDFRKRSCSIDEESSIMTQSPESQTSESQREIRDFDVYDLLHMQPGSHLLRYVVTTKIQHEFVDVALYEIEVPKLRVLPERTTFEMPGLCLEHLIKNCENCTNFQSRDTKGYDIFLLIALFVACFIIRIQHNYHEGKYFFGTAIGLLVIWVIWLTCFISMQPENRDAVIFFGTVATAYLIIFGVLIPRIYYITHIPKRKDSGQRFDPVNLLTDSTVNTIIRQSCSSHDYVYPVRESQVLRMPSVDPNYYSNLSSNSKYFERCRSPNHYEMPTYNNCESFAEMKEIDAAYVNPRMYVENMEFLATNNVIYAQPKIYKSQRINLEERNNTETTCNRDNSSPISRQHIEMYPIRYTSPTNVGRKCRINEEEDEEEEDEKDQENEGASRITRF